MTITKSIPIHWSEIWTWDTDSRDYVNHIIYLTTTKHIAKLKEQGKLPRDLRKQWYLPLPNGSNIYAHAFHPTAVDDSSGIIIMWAATLYPPHVPQDTHLILKIYNSEQWTSMDKK